MVKKDVLTLYYNIKDLGKYHMDIDYETFLKTVEQLEDAVIKLYFDFDISDSLKRYLTRKIRSLYNSYKYNMLYLKEYRNEKIFY